MAKTTVAILGGRGMLGTDLAPACRQQGFEVKVYDLPDFDITDESCLRAAVNNADLIVNCASYTDVEKAEDEADLAYKVNAAAAGKLGCLAKDAGIWVLHIGTDFIFDGKLNRPYLETDLPRPINVYGKTKLAGEELLSQSGCKHCIVRLEWTYGRGGKNFITKLIAAAKPGKSIKVVDDQVGSPTATTELAKVICKLLSKRPEGIFHFASSGYASRFEVAKFVFDKLGISVDLVSCKSNEYNAKAARPLNSRFNCRKIQALLGEPIEMWQVPLERFLEQL